MPIDTAILPDSVVYVEHSGPWAKISDPCSKMHCVNKKLIRPQLTDVDQSGCVAAGL